MAPLPPHPSLLLVHLPSRALSECKRIGPVQEAEADDSDCPDISGVGVVRPCGTEHLWSHRIPRARPRERHLCLDAAQTKVSHTDTEVVVAFSAVAGYQDVLQF